MASDERDIEALVDVLSSYTALEDCRDALNQLLDLCKGGDYRISVATYGKRQYIDLLKSDDAGIVDTTLQIILRVFSSDHNEDDGIGAQLVKTYLNTTGFLANIQTHLSSSSFAARNKALEIVHRCLTVQLVETCDRIVEFPAAISDIVDLLTDKHEFLRNTAIVVVTKLVKGNSNIKNMLLFGNVFQHVLDIASKEEVDSIVIEDCFYIVHSLLERNDKGRRLFSETSLLQKLVFFVNEFLEHSSQGGIGEWGPQHANNLQRILSCVNVLVWSNDGNDYHNQLCFDSEGLTFPLFVQSLDYRETGLLHIIWETVGYLLRGNNIVQANFGKRTVMSSDDNPELFVDYLLLCIFNEEMNKEERYAAYFCVASWLYKDGVSKLELLNQLETENSIARNTVIGALTTEGTSPELVWYATSIILNATVNNVSFATFKPLFVKEGERNVMLLEHLYNYLALVDCSEENLPIHIGILGLIAGYLYQFNEAIEIFMKIEGLVDYITGILSDQVLNHLDAKKNRLLQGMAAVIVAICVKFWKPSKLSKMEDFRTLLGRRVGNEQIVSALNYICRNEWYISAVKEPFYWSIMDNNPIMLDHTYCDFLLHRVAPFVKFFTGDSDILTDAEARAFVDLRRQQTETIDLLKSSIEKTNLGLVPATKAEADAERKLLLDDMERIMNRTIARETMFPSDTLEGLRHSAHILSYCTLNKSIINNLQALLNATHESAETYNTEVQNLKKNVSEFVRKDYQH